MKFTNTIHISDSLWRLIMERKGECKPLRFLIAANRALTQNRERYTTPGRYLAARSTSLRMHYRRSDVTYQTPRERSRLLAPKFPGNYFTFREQTGMISYMPNGREQKFNADGTWRREGRQSMKPGKWLRAMLNPLLAKRIGDAELGEFATIVKHEELRQALAFRVVPVKQAYSKKKFTKFTSCMWDLPVHDFYLSFGCKALVAVGHDGKWRGRAILWPAVQITVDGKTRGDDIMFLDRVYADTEEVSVAMREHAGKQGWFRKARQNREPSEPVVAPDGEGMKAELVVKTETNLSELDFYPYLDTFAFGKDNFTLSNRLGLGAKFTYQNAAESAGMRTGDDRVRDHVSNRLMRRSEAVADYNGHWIRRDEAVSIEGRHYHRDDRLIVTCRISGVQTTRNHAYRIFETDEGNEEASYFVHQRFVSRPGAH